MNPDQVEQIIKMIEHNEEVFTVLRDKTVGDFRILWVYYPNCPNGNKIMVFTGYIPDITKKILPHFGREDSPVARFEPTERGWEFAVAFAESQFCLSALHDFTKWWEEWKNYRKEIADKFLTEKGNFPLPPNPYDAGLKR